MKYFASLIIPTYGREKELCNTLCYAVNQDYYNFEILVIDQTINHKPETNNLLSNFSDVITVIQLRPPSLTSARNKGICAAKGKIIIMVDDDIIINNDFISKHMRHYDDPKVIAVTGKVIQNTIKKKHVPVWIKNEFIQWLSFDQFEENNYKEAFRCTGGNFSFRKESGDKAFLFDENFIGTSWGEEYDFSFRLKKNNKKIIYDPEASIIHLNSKCGGCEKRKRYSLSVVYSHFYNMAYLLSKNKLNLGILNFYMIWYTYKLVFFKREYLTPKGIFFLFYSQFRALAGLFNGYRKGIKNRN